MNGRSFGDSLGKFTYHGPNGSSLIDYGIISESLLPSVIYFQVGDLCRTLSDHCHLTTRLIASWKPMYSKSDMNNTFANRNFQSVYKYEKTSTPLFIKAFESEEIQAMVSSYMEKDFNSISNKPDDTVIDFNKIILEAANRSLKKRNNIHKKKPQKCWFNAPLQAQKERVDELSALLSKNPNNHKLRSLLFKTMKEYKKNVKIQRKRYYSNLVAKLDNLHENDPSQYWKILNSLKEEKGAKKAPPNIPLHVFEEHFKSLNSITENSDIDCLNKRLWKELHNTPFTNNNYDVSILNENISNDEITVALKSLKKGKSCGLDHICGEMLKDSVCFMLPCLNKLFNFIFRCSVYPQIWKTGYITPVPKSGDVSDP